MIAPTRLGHCTPTLGGHSPACIRDGSFCSLASSHDGPCRPHGNIATTVCRNAGHGSHAGPCGAWIDNGWTGHGCHCGGHGAPA